MFRTSWIVWLGVLCLAACGKKGPSSYYEPMSASEEAPNMDLAAPMAKRRDSRGASPPPPPPPPQAMPAAPQVASVAAPEPEPEPEEAGAERMIHYDGFAEIRTPRAEELIESVIALAEEAGGSVETRSLSRVTVRVPVELFDTSWTSILDMGPVVRRTLGAEDVTDAFTDLGLRLRSMEATRDRLNELLAKEAELEERIRLLKEIHRLNAEILMMSAHLEVLADLAAMSRITVVAIAPDLHANATRALPYGMGWIDGLSAFDHSMVHDEKRGSLEVPEGFVALGPRRFHAQAADGATAWAFRLRNDPEGTGPFWRDAVVDRIGEQLEDGTLTEVGGWSLVRFVEPGAKEPYVWHLGFRVQGRHLEVFQVTYPTEAQEQRYHQAVTAILQEGQA